MSGLDYRQVLNFLGKHKDAFSVTSGGVDVAFPPGHFYSPDIDAKELGLREQELWPVVPPPFWELTSTWIFIGLY